MKAAILFLLLILAGPHVYGIIDGGYPVVVEISKSNDGKDIFDVVNLTREDGAVEAAKWIYSLYSDSRNKKRQYSNAVHLRFSSEFEDKEIKRIWAVFEMSKVYVLTTTMEKNGKRVPLMKDIGVLDDLDALLEVGGLSPDEVTALREVRRQLAKTEQGADHPATAPASKPETQDKPQPESKPTPR